MQQIAHLQRKSDLGQRLLIDETGAQPAQIAFGKTLELLEQEVGGDAIQQAVAEKLKPLVVGRSRAAMCQRLDQERPVLELML